MALARVFRGRLVHQHCLFSTAAAYRAYSICCWLFREANSGYILHTWRKRRQKWSIKQHLSRTGFHASRFINARNDEVVNEKQPMKPYSTYHHHHRPSSISMRNMSVGVTSISINVSKTGRESVFALAIQYCWYFTEIIRI